MPGDTTYFAAGKGAMRLFITARYNDDGFAT